MKLAKKVASVRGSLGGSANTTPPKASTDELKRLVHKGFRPHGDSILRQAGYGTYIGWDPYERFGLLMAAVELEARGELLTEEQKRMFWELYRYLHRERGDLLRRLSEARPLIYDVMRPPHAVLRSFPMR